MTLQTWIIVVLAAVVIGAVLYGVVQGLLGKEPRRDGRPKS